MLVDARHDELRNTAAHNQSAIGNPQSAMASLPRRHFLAVAAAAATGSMIDARPAASAVADPEQTAVELLTPAAQKIH